MGRPGPKGCRVASLYRRRKKFWISFYLDGQLVQKSLKTDNERIALAKKKQLEYELSIGDLHQVSQLQLATMVEAFCQHVPTSGCPIRRSGDLAAAWAKSASVLATPVCVSAESRAQGYGGLVDRIQNAQ